MEHLRHDYRLASRKYTRVLDYPWPQLDTVVGETLVLGLEYMLDKK